MQKKQPSQVELCILAEDTRFSLDALINENGHITRLGFAFYLMLRCNSYNNTRKCNLIVGLILK